MVQILYMKIQTLLIAFLLLTNYIFGQNKFSPKELTQDLDSLVKNIEDIHPNPYYKYTKNKFYKDIETAKSQLRKSMDYLDFYFIAQRLVAKLEDGHIDIEMPFDHTDANNYVLFPFEVNLSTSSPFMVIVNHKSIKYSDILAGSEITSVNGIPSEKIASDIISLVTGETKEFRAKYGAKHLDFYINELYPKQKSLKISYKINRQHKTIKVIQETKTQKNVSAIPHLPIVKPNRPFQLKILKKGTALISLRDFEDMEKFQFFADSAFAELNALKTKNLIIDLRDNLGGDSDVGDYLLQYLLNHPFSQYSQVLEKNSRLLKNRLIRHNLGKVLSAQDSLLLSKKNGTLDTIINGTDTPLDLSNRFFGKVSLLINSQTFSSAADFAQAFAYYHRGEVIGEESGGQIMSFGDIVPATLTVTGMPFVVSSKLYMNIGAKAGDWHGVIPSLTAKSEDALKKALFLLN